MTMIHFNLATVVFLAASYGIPGLASLLTFVKWPTWVTGVISLVLASAGGLLTEASQPGFDWRGGALLALSSLGVALIAHKQLWEGPLADGLHRIGLTGVTVHDLDMGVGYLEHSSFLPPYVPPADVPDAVSDAPSARHPSPGPLVTGSLAPEQTALEA